MKVVFDIEELSKEESVVNRYIVQLYTSKDKLLHTYRVPTYADVQVIVKHMKQKYKSHLELVRNVK